MDCKDVRNNLSLYIDEELEYDELEKIRNHLNSCTSCFDEYEQILKNRNTLREVPHLPLPEGFKEELHKRLVKEKKIKSIKNWKRYSLIAALFLIAIVSILERDLISYKMNLDKDSTKSKESLPMQENARMFTNQNDDKMEMKSLDFADNHKASEDAAAENSTGFIESEEEMGSLDGGANENVPMGLLRSDIQMTKAEDALGTSIAIIIDDNLKDISTYLDDYAGSFNLQEKVFEAALDSSTPELEIDVPTDEFDAIFNYLADYPHTIDYLQIEESEEVNNNFKEKGNVIIIITKK